jgi:outer membrane protein assembly factor BamB
MRRLIATAFFLFLSPALESMAQSQTSDSDHWPRWRDPDMNGVAADAAPPTVWSESENIRWKIEVPGSGYATPIIWGEKLFLLSAVPVDSEAQITAVEEEPSEDSGRGRRGGRNVSPTTAFEYTVFALNRNDGTVIWKQVAKKELPHQGIHRTASWSSSSPVTDGEHLIAFFGSQGIFCYDLEGNLQWQKDLGDMDIKMSFGEGGSPALHGNTVVVNWDHEGDSFIVALDKRTGDEIWRKSRDERTSWSTPHIVEVNGKPQAIVNATNRIRAYDLATGEVVWECGGMTGNVIPVPVVSDGIAYVMSGFRGAALRAIDLSEAQGDITDGEAIEWSHDRDMPYVPSPLLYEDLLYAIKGNDGMLSCFDAKTGEVHFESERIEPIREVYSSPVGANGYVYLFGRDGEGLVLEKGPDYKVVANNTLEDGFSASPAVVGKDLYLRGHQFLYCVSEN